MCGLVEEDVFAVGGACVARRVCGAGGGGYSHTAWGQGRGRHRTQAPSLLRVMRAAKAEGLRQRGPCLQRKCR